MDRSFPQRCSNCSSPPSLTRNRFITLARLSRPDGAEAPHNAHLAQGKGPSECQTFKEVAAGTEAVAPRDGSFASLGIHEAVVKTDHQANLAAPWQSS